MECRECCESLTAFVDGELLEPIREEVESHLSRCARCEAEYASFLYTVQLTDSMSWEVLPAPAWSRIESRLSPPPTPFWDFGWLFRYSWAPSLAAVMMLALSIPLLLQYEHPTEDADLRQLLTLYVQERDLTEIEHHGIIQAEPVGWTPYNPFAEPDFDPPSNPFAE